MTDIPRLIEHAFPLQQTSLDSVHEKNVRHGHISTLHIWPARRPLAACRAALIATLLPDPSAQPKPEGMSDDQWRQEVIRRRRELCERIGGKVVKKQEKKKMPNGQIVEREKESTEGGILHWGRETENAKELDWFRQEIRKAYGGRAPRVLDPFAGGGAIPLEAMRLGCEVTAVDLNPVAWFILKCTLEYPQKLAGKSWPLPGFILGNEEFMEAFYKAHPHLVGRTKKTKKQLAKEAQAPNMFDRPDTGRAPKADLAWQVRAWGQWVLDQARRELAAFYPVYADFEPLDQRMPKPFEPQPMRLVSLAEEGTPEIEKLNGEFSAEYLEDKRNPRWVAKPTVAYLWARTVQCKHCRASVPLLKTRWLCKKDKKRVLLAMAPNEGKTGVVFDVQINVPAQGGNAAQRREHDKRIGAGTMSRSGAKCPCCGTIMTMEDIRLEGQAGRLGAVNTAVVVDGQKGKEYRLPTGHEVEIVNGQNSGERPAGRAGDALPGGARVGDARSGLSPGAAFPLARSGSAIPPPDHAAFPSQPLPGKGTPGHSPSRAGYSLEEEVQRVFEGIPFGVPDEPTPKAGIGASRAFSVDGYGMRKWQDLFTLRQLLALGTFVKWTRAAKEGMVSDGFVPLLCEAVTCYLAATISKLLDYESSLTSWYTQNEQITHLFNRFALPIKWDYAEASPIGGASGSWDSMLLSVTKPIDTSMTLPSPLCEPSILNRSAISFSGVQCDAVVTDPPYYDSIPYSDLMDFFYIWLRRTLNGLSPELDLAFEDPLSPKWNHEQNDGELIDDAGRHCGSKDRSKSVYEEGMYQTFQASYSCLKDDGRLVVVFAHKHPDAWETLVSAIIRAGFVVDGSWPIQTEMSNRTRSHGSAALASSVWLVCKKRPTTARPGWDTQVLEAMHQNIREKLREFWDAGIRGPDFVWAATGPALEAYSRHPVVRKANEPGPLTVTEFLTQVRRMVVDFVVGRVLSGEEEGGAELAAADRLDEPTAYYLLHRHDFGLDEAPAGACILYAVSCGLSDRELAGAWDLIGFAKGKSSDGDEDEDADADADAEAEVEESGSKIKLKTWAQRKGRSLGYEAPGGRPVPLIDRIHCLMHLWKAGDLHQVDGYLDDNGLRRQELFKRLLQSLIELSPQGSEERALLESLSNHVQGRGAVKDDQVKLVFESEVQ